MIGVEFGMPLRELVGQRLIFGSCAFAPRGRSRRARRRLDPERDDASLRHSTFGARTTLNEGDDCAMHFLRRAQIAFVHTEIATAVAHHHVAIARQAASRNALESEPPKTRQELVGVARRSVELEGELRRVMPAETEDRPQRTKHFTGPATKSRCSGDHTSVDTSMSASAMRMLFTDDGRPPRERLLIVPDVEMIVPRFVCSM